MTALKDIRFSEFLKPENILSNLPAVSRDKVITQLAETLLRNQGGFDKETAIRGVLEREKVSPTVIAPGIALPHARFDGLEHPLVAVATSSRGIDFLAPGEEPVNVVILILTPKSDPGAYLRLVAAAAKVLAAPRMRPRLAVCTSSKEVYGLLTENAVSLPAYLTARDVMDPNPVTLAEGDHLAQVIETFCTERVTDIPIVDEVRDLRGMISIEDLLRLSLPQHLLWMEDLSPILRFQPFAEVLRKDRETKVADFMREKYVSIHPDTPAMQLAKMFLMREVRQIQVLEGRHLAGVVNLDSFIAQLFWA